MTEQTMRAWAVTLSFAGGGPLFVNTLTAPTAEVAVAMTMLALCRQGVPAQEMQGVGCLEMPADWLRWALKTIETGEPHKAPVVSLVPSEPGPTIWNRPPPWNHAEAGCPLHGWVFVNGCGDCARAFNDQNQAQAYQMPTEPPDPA